MTVHRLPHRIRALQLPPSFSVISWGPLTSAPRFRFPHLGANRRLKAEAGAREAAEWVAAGATLAVPEFS